MSHNIVVEGIAISAAKQEDEPFLWTQAELYGCELGRGSPSSPIEAIKRASSA